VTRLTRIGHLLGAAVFTFVELDYLWIDGLLGGRDRKLLQGTQAEGLSDPFMRGAVSAHRAELN
jgi:hypothetical protein